MNEAHLRSVEKIENQRGNCQGVDCYDCPFNVDGCGASEDPMTACKEWRDNNSMDATTQTIDALQLAGDYEQIEQIAQYAIDAITNDEEGACIKIRPGGIVVVKGE